MKERIAAFIEVFLLFSITILTTFLVLTLSSCGTSEADNKPISPSFDCVYDSGWWEGRERVRVLVDQKTDLVYVIYGDGQRRSISPLYRTPTEVYTYTQWKEDYSENYYVSTLQSDEPIDGLRIPKVIAKITFCGAVGLDIYDYMNWNPPTPEQIKNLKEMLNIDVELME